MEEVECEKGEECGEKGVELKEEERIEEVREEMSRWNTKVAMIPCFVGDTDRTIYAQRKVTVSASREGECPK